jgi:hypothetical protein
MHARFSAATQLWLLAPEEPNVYRLRSQSEFEAPEVRNVSIAE